MSSPKPLPITNAYELLIQGVMDYAIYMLDPDGRVVSWNPGAEHIKGYSASEIIGEHFSRFYTAEERDGGLPERSLRIAEEAGRFKIEGWRQRKDGTRFWATVVIDPIYQAGKLVGFAKITRDITEQREAQQALLESERRFRLLVESVVDYAIFMLDPNGIVTNWNVGAQRIKGYTAAEIIGRHFSTFYTPEEIEAGDPVTALSTARREGRYDAEAWRLRKDGSRFWASVVIDAIYDRGELVGFAKITRDLTERREAQLQLERSREQLFQSQKMEAVGQLTGGLAHDFNNLLTGISGSLDLLKLRVAQGRTAELDRYMTAARASTDRAAALTHRMLAFARRQALDPRPTDPTRLVVEMKELVERTVGPQIKVTTQLALAPWTILCDPHQLENALLNLCINARDAMPDGGEITVEVANLTLDDFAGRMRDLPPGDYVSLGISDTGTGMSPEVASRAFDPFFTTKPLGLGTGLGLSMTYGFARQSGGQVRIHSQVGEGTTVRMLLPRGGHQAEGQTPHAGPADVPRASAGETVMVVDDEPAIGMLVAEILQDLGYGSLEASDGLSGLKILQSPVRIDLLITDVGLPGGMNGRQLADAARQLRPGLKVLFITGYAETAVVRDGHLEAGMHLLTKPFAMDTLAARIKAIITDS